MKTFLLVHGAWHSAHHWNAVALGLARLGHRAVLLDLPGHGSNARLPSAYLFGPGEAMATEPSPVAGISLADAAVAVSEAITELGAAGPIVVGHSLGGPVITQAAEQVPDLVERLVYVAAHCPVRLGSAGAYGMLPEADTGFGGDIFVADPAAIGAVRINPRGDETYLQKIWQAYYNDISFEDFLVHAQGLTPDLPVDFWIGTPTVTAGNWGRVPRTYVRALHDRALSPALQDMMIADADALAPDNPFDVHTLDTSHSPFASRPDELAALLAGLA